jgi:hypothetical protein
MRTFIIILVGYLLLGAAIGVARFASVSTDTMRLVIAGFVVVWLVIAGVNMWLGVTTAGYSLREELPIFLLIFALPVAAALFVIWQFS